MKKCYVCGSEKDELRPYGPRGEWICFSCGMLPERIKQTEEMFAKQLNSCGENVLIGLEEGPIPLNPQQLNG